MAKNNLSIIPHIKLSEKELKQIIRGKLKCSTKVLPGAVETAVKTAIDYYSHNKKGKKAAAFDMLRAINDLFCRNMNNPLIDKYKKEIDRIFGLNDPALDKIIAAQNIALDLGDSFEINELAELFDGIEDCAEFDDFKEIENISEIGELAGSEATATKTKSAITRFYNEITKEIIDEIKKGTVPWQSGITHKYLGNPMNMRSKKIYHGLNILRLGGTDYDSRWWATKKQIKQFGGELKKDQKPSRIMFFKLSKAVDATGGIVLDSKGNEKLIALRKLYSVYNLEQINGIDRSKFPEAPTTGKEQWTPNKLAENIKDDYLKRTKIPLKQGNKTPAFYRPSEDFVYMPYKKLFEKPENYYEYLFHEFGHSTMHAKRLKRIYGAYSKFTVSGKKNYSFEELVAEFCTAFVCGFCGLKRMTKNHASYIKGWGSYLTNNKESVIKSVMQARKASNFILGKYLKKFHDEIRAECKKASKKIKSSTKKPINKINKQKAKPKSKPESKKPAKPKKKQKQLAGGAETVEKPETQKKTSKKPVKSVQKNSEGKSLASKPKPKQNSNKKPAKSPKTNIDLGSMPENFQQDESVQLFGEIGGIPKMIFTSSEDKRIDRDAKKVIQQIKDGILNADTLAREIEPHLQLSATYQKAKNENKAREEGIKAFGFLIALKRVNPQHPTLLRLVPLFKLKIG